MNADNFNPVLSKIMFVFFITALLASIIASYADFGERLWEFSRSFEAWELDELFIAISLGFFAAFLTSLALLIRLPKKLKSERSVYGMRSQVEIERLLIELKSDTNISIDEPRSNPASRGNVNSYENFLTIRALEWVIGKEIDDDSPISRYR